MALQNSVSVEGWPPDKDRFMPHYIHPYQDTFSIRPSKAKFKGCQLLIVVHSTLEAFHQRQSVRETWIQDFVKYRQGNIYLSSIVIAFSSLVAKLMLF